MLNDRQKKLYNFLIDESKRNEFISKEEICTVLNELYPRSSEITSEHNSKVFARIRNDIRAINSSDVYKIVISSLKGYKIATKSEAEDYISRRFERDLKSLRLNWILKGKMERDGQMFMREDGTYHEISTFAERE